MSNIENNNENDNYEVKFEDLECGVMDFFKELGLLTDEDVSSFVIKAINYLEFHDADSLLAEIEDELDVEAEEGVSDFLESLRDFCAENM